MNPSHPENQCSIPSSEEKHRFYFFTQPQKKLVSAGFMFQINLSETQQNNGQRTTDNGQRTSLACSIFKSKVFYSGLSRKVYVHFSDRGTPAENLLRRE
jgi:hypothetical protein